MGWEEDRLAGRISNPAHMKLSRVNGRIIAQRVTDFTLN
jgi:hypothetical protein